MSKYFTGLNVGKYKYEYYDKPIFEKYEEIEVDDYCPECGSWEGSHTETRGINQIGFKRTKRRVYAMERTMANMLANKILDSIFAKSIISIDMPKEVNG